MRTSLHLLLFSVAGVHKRSEVAGDVGARGIGGRLNRESQLLVRQTAAQRTAGLEERTALCLVQPGRVNGYGRWHQFRRVFTAGRKFINQVSVKFRTSSPEPPCILLVSQKAEAKNFRARGNCPSP